MRPVDSNSTRKGAAVIELAVVLPVLLLILLATIEITSMTFLKQSLKIAAYEATRIALVPNSELANVEAGAQEILNTRKVKDFTIEITPSDFADRPYGTSITVKVTADCSSNCFLNSMLFKGKQVHGQMTMMKEYD